MVTGRARRCVAGVALVVLALLGAWRGLGRSDDSDLRPWTGRCVSASDGDTVHILRGRDTLDVRIQGIDCPERGQPYGRQARERTRSLLVGRKVAVKPLSRDRYGRLVADLTSADGVDVATSLTEEGLAWWYVKYAPTATHLNRAEAAARAARRGLWADAQPEAPWEYRRQRRAASAGSNAAAKADDPSR